MTELLGELLERCRRGDPDAVATLVHRFQAWALDLAAALLGDRHLAEDAVQAAFVRALARLNDLRDTVAFPAWLRQVIRTECHAIARRPQTQALNPAADPPATSPTPAEHVEALERCRLVREALAQLPAGSRDAAELFYLDELDCAEVAERLRVPAGTVKRRLHDARLRLRGMLLPYVEPPPKAMKPPGGQMPL